jgi:mRNA-degrading endonuclease HigB of HigAB toxin-antitoxin module
MVDITRCIICGEAFVSIFIGKVILRTHETAVENFLHAMVTASSELDVEHSIDLRLEHFKLCGMTTVFDVVGNSYRLHQANRYD